MPPVFSARWRLVKWLLALFLVAVGAKLWLIHVYGTQVPYLDEWVEADAFLKPWVEGHLTWHNWFEPHNEHRIFFTRLFNVVCIELGGEWDPLVQMVINSLLHAGTLCGLVYCLWVFENKRDQGVLCLLLAPFLALPFAAENTLWGIQSQVYFLLLMGGAAIVGLGFHRPGSLAWLLGLAAAAGSLFTMVSGLTAALAVVGLLGLRSLKQRRFTRGNCVTVAGCVAIFGCGMVLLAVSGTPTGHSWGSIAVALAWILAWPFENKPTLLLFTCLPLGLTAVKYLRGDFKDARAAEFLLALGFWGFLQAGAIAYGRSGMVNCSRYTDVFCLIPMASLASLFILGEGGLSRNLSRGWLTALAAGWVVIVLAGVWNISPRNWQNYDDGDNYPLWFMQTMLVQEENVRDIVSTDRSEVAVHTPDRDSLTNLLANPKLSRILPPVCRPALNIEKGEGSDAGFVLNGYSPDRPKQEFARAWGNYSTNGARTGRFVSEPLTARLPKLDLQLCCIPDRENVRIELVEQASGRRVSVVPRATGQWQTVTVDASRSPFRLEITDQNPRSWVAVGDLREHGRLSDEAQHLLAWGPFILLAGLFLFAGLAGHDVVRGVGELHSSPVIRWAVLAAAVAALAGVWCGRNFNATDLKCELYAHCAQNYAVSGRFVEARRMLDEARWLEPDNAKWAAQLRALRERARQAP